MLYNVLNNGVENGVYRWMTSFFMAQEGTGRMNRRGARNFAITAAVLLALGAALSRVPRPGMSTGGAALASDVLFGQATAFLVWGLIRLLVNMKMFTSFAWGVKSLRKLFRNKAENSAEMKDGYLEYRNSRPHHGDVPALMIAAAALMAASVLVAVLAG